MPRISTWTCNLQQIEMAQRESRHLPQTSPLKGGTGLVRCSVSVPLPGGSCILRRAAETGKGGSVSVAQEKLPAGRPSRFSAQERGLSVMVERFHCMLYYMSVHLSEDGRKS